MTIRQHVFHLPVDSGHRLCIWRVPADPDNIGDIIVHVPAFAEEMNKTRRMTAHVARELAARGFGVLQVDLLGCGDSSGDFADATWEQWITDLVAAAEWARCRHGGELWPW